MGGWGVAAVASWAGLGSVRQPAFVFLFLFSGVAVVGDGVGKLVSVLSPGLSKLRPGGQIPPDAYFYK